VTILCGTDLSDASRLAADAAGAFARKSGHQLLLTHVVPSGEDDRKASADLQQIAARLRELGTDVVEHCTRGNPADVLAELADKCGSKLIVLAPSSDPVRVRFGGTADRLIAEAGVPVLVVREGFPFREWIEDRTALRVAVAIDLSPISDNAVSWVSTLEEYGPMELTALHIEWPTEAYDRIGLEGPMPLDWRDPLVKRLVDRELEAERLRLGGGSRPAALRTERSAADPAEALVRMAASVHADLVVVGHRPKRQWRIWEGSVARAVLRAAPMAVACVPDNDAPVPVETQPVRCIVAATDLSLHGNAAVSYALSLAPPDARVIILHVLDRGPVTPEERARIIDGLSMFATRRDLLERRVSARVEIVESDDPASAIVDSAEAHQADLLCIAARGTSRLPRFMLGSVAQAVLLRSRRPVMIMP
jgi:nucleotide-binding universal stress UspA family protein